MTKMYLLIDWNSLKRSTRHATENSTSLHDEKSRPPGENHRAHQEVFQQGFDKKNEDRYKNNINNVHPWTRRAPHPLKLLYYNPNPK
uniref:Uncharacterized protein n=1 Tax=Bursaphelenchus xylophilus TaxID=6326 RepID=A0A1I7S8J6_BURXY